MSKQYQDRFSEATAKLTEKSAFKCETCNRTYEKDDAEKQNMSCCGRTLTQLKREAFGP